MTKKCIYCSTPIKDESVIDFCERCGVGVWGKKMFDTIVANMESARDNDDLVNNFQSSASPPKDWKGSR